MKTYQTFDGFLWADCTEVAEKLWSKGCQDCFEFYAIYDDGSESLIEDLESITKAISSGCKICIELCPEDDVVLLSNEWREKTISDYQSNKI